MRWSPMKYTNAIACQVVTILNIIKRYLRPNSTTKACSKPTKIHWTNFQGKILFLYFIYAASTHFGHPTEWWTLAWQFDSRTNILFPNCVMNCTAMPICWRCAVEYSHFSLAPQCWAYWKWCISVPPAYYSGGGIMLNYRRMRRSVTSNKFGRRVCLPSKASVPKSLILFVLLIPNKMHIKW